GAQPGAVATTARAARDGGERVPLLVLGGGRAAALLPQRAGRRLEAGAGLRPPRPARDSARRLGALRPRRRPGGDRQRRRSEEPRAAPSARRAPALGPHRRRTAAGASDRRRRGRRESAPRARLREL